VGQVVHTLPEGKQVCGVALLAGEIYLLRWKASDQVEVYDVITYSFRRHVHVPDLCGFSDITPCNYYRCVYIADNLAECIHRLEAQGAPKRWEVGDRPWGLSVNAAHNVLVTCLAARKIMEFSSHGDLQREITLPSDVVNPWHAIQLIDGHYIVCHDRPSDTGDTADHLVSKITKDGSDIVRSMGGQSNMPCHLAVDDNDSVFVADVLKQRVTMVSSTFDDVRPVVSQDKLKGRPCQLYFDIPKRRLYVSDNEYENNEFRAGRVVVFSDDIVTRLL